MCVELPRVAHDDDEEGARRSDGDVLMLMEVDDDVSADEGATTVMRRQSLKVVVVKAIVSLQNLRWPARQVPLETNCNLNQLKQVAERKQTREREFKINRGTK
jgi:hypothetical protein